MFYVNNKVQNSTCGANCDRRAIYKSDVVPMDRWLRERCKVDARHIAQVCAPCEHVRLLYLTDATQLCETYTCSHVEFNKVFVI